MNHVDVQARVSEIMTGLTLQGPAPSLPTNAAGPVAPPTPMETTPFAAYQNQLLIQQNQLLALLALILIDLKETLNYQSMQPRP